MKPVVASPLTHVLSLAESEDGERLAVGHGGKEVVILRLPEGAEVQRIALPYFERVSRGLTPLTFVNHDRNLVTASDAGRIDIWDVADGRHVRTLDGHASSVTAFASSPDGRLLASAGLDQVVKLWDLQSQGRAPYRVLRGHGDEVWGVR